MRGSTVLDGRDTSSPVISSACLPLRDRTGCIEVGSPRARRQGWRKDQKGARSCGRHPAADFLIRKTLDGSGPSRASPTVLARPPPWRRDNPSYRSCGDRSNGRFGASAGKVAAPFLVFNRHHVGMAREDIARIFARADGGEDIGTVASRLGKTVASISSRAKRLRI